MLLGNFVLVVVSLQLWESTAGKGIRFASASGNSHAPAVYPWVLTIGSSYTEFSKTFCSRRLVSLRQLRPASYKNCSHQICWCTYCGRSGGLFCKTVLSIRLARELLPRGRLPSLEPFTSARSETFVRLSWSPQSFASVGTGNLIFFQCKLQGPLKGGLRTRLLFLSNFDNHFALM